MYISALIPRNFTDFTEAVQIVNRSAVVKKIGVEPVYW